MIVRNKSNTCQVSIDESSLHRFNFMRALDKALVDGDLSRYQVELLRRDYDKVE